MRFTVPFVFGLLALVVAVACFAGASYVFGGVLAVVGVVLLVAAYRRAGSP